MPVEGLTEYADTYRLLSILCITAPDVRGRILR